MKESNIDEFKAKVEKAIEFNAESFISMLPNVLGLMKIRRQLAKEYLIQNGKDALGKEILKRNIESVNEEIKHYIGL